jgi:alpha-N-arabinofuranosidase
MITTLVNRRPWRSRNFFVTTDDPAGDWSEPIWVDEGGIDPDLCFDDNGTVYYTRNGQGICSTTIDPVTGETGTMRTIWSGTPAGCGEGAHLYHIDGTYYLMIAEGGTRYGHQESIARSDRPEGPFEPCPHNPILTHRNRWPYPIQCTGHADLIQAHDGSWWLVFLGVRLRSSERVPVQHLGRETFLAPVTWENGWPVINGDGTVDLEMCVGTLEQIPVPNRPPEPTFAAGDLDPCWNYLRNPHEAHYRIADPPGSASLRCAPIRLSDCYASGSPTMLIRRQEHFAARVEATVEFDPANGERAGLVVWMDARHHYALSVSGAAAGRRVELRRCVEGVESVSARADLPDGPIRLAIDADAASYTFSWAGADDAEFHRLDQAGAAYISSDIAWTFTGMYVGLFAERDDDQPGTWARFEQIAYRDEPDGLD